MRKYKVSFGLLILTLFVVWCLGAGQPAQARPTGSNDIFLPIVAKPVSCEVEGTSFDSVAIVGEPYGGDAATEEEFNLGYRGYEPTTAALELTELGPVHDVNAPQFNTIFSDNRLPTFSNAYQRYRWDNGQPLDTQSPWDTTVLGMAVTPGEELRVPDSGYVIDGEHDAMVLYADPERITLKYTREDNIIFGYTVYIEDICVEPDLLALYNSLDNAGRTQLPALNGRQPIGRALRDEIKVAVRDTGHFLDPRSCNDWWQAFPGQCD